MHREQKAQVIFSICLIAMGLMFLWQSFSFVSGGTDKLIPQVAAIVLISFSGILLLQNLGRRVWTNDAANEFGGISVPFVASSIYVIASLIFDFYIVTIIFVGFGTWYFLLRGSHGPAKRGRRKIAVCLLYALLFTLFLYLSFSKLLGVSTPTWPILWS